MLSRLAFAAVCGVVIVAGQIDVSAPWPMPNADLSHTGIGPAGTTGLPSATLLWRTQPGGTIQSPPVLSADG